MHMLQMLRQTDCSGQIEDLSHVVPADRLSDCWTKGSATLDAFVQVVNTGAIADLDMHLPFRSRLQHKALYGSVVTQHIWPSSALYQLPRPLTSGISLTA